MSTELPAPSWTPLNVVSVVSSRRIAGVVGQSRTDSNTDALKKGRTAG